MLDANDGIISTTGTIQGFAGAGADDQTVLFAAMTLMITGGLSLGGAAFAEAAQDRAAPDARAVLTGGKESRTLTSAAHAGPSARPEWAPRLEHCE